MSDTPRTDAAVSTGLSMSGWDATYAEMTDFARQLERELTIALSRRAQADVIAENAALRERSMKAEALLHETADALESEVEAEQEAAWKSIRAYFDQPV